MIYAQLVRTEGRDAFLMIAILLLCVYAISRAVFPKVFTELISPSRLFAFRVREDLGSNLRPFSSEHLFFTALSSLSFSFIILYTVNGLLPEDQVFKILTVKNIWLAVPQWLALAIVLNLLVYIKFLLILTFSWLFDLRNFLSRHFIDMVNASIFFFLLLLICLIFTVFSHFIPPHGLLKVVAIGVGIFFYYRALLLYMRLLNDRVHSKLYIFSYICATELMPLTIGLILVTHSQI